MTRPGLEFVSIWSSESNVEAQVGMIGADEVAAYHYSFRLMMLLSSRRQRRSTPNMIDIPKLLLLQSSSIVEIWSASTLMPRAIRKSSLICE